MPSSFEIVALLLEARYYSEKLFIVNIVVYLSRDYLSAIKGYRVKLTVLLALREDTAYSVVRGVGFYRRGEIGIEVG